MTRHAPLFAHRSQQRDTTRSQPIMHTKSDTTIANEVINALLKNVKYAAIKLLLNRIQQRFPAIQPFEYIIQNKLQGFIDDKTNDIGDMVRAQIQRCIRDFYRDYNEQLALKQQAKTITPPPAPVIQPKPIEHQVSTQAPANQSKAKPAAKTIQNHSKDSQKGDLSAEKLITLTPEAICNYIKTLELHDPHLVKLALYPELKARAFKYLQALEASADNEQLLQCCSKADTALGKFFWTKIGWFRLLGSNDKPSGTTRTIIQLAQTMRTTLNSKRITFSETDSESIALTQDNLGLMMMSNATLKLTDTPTSEDHEHSEHNALELDQPSQRSLYFLLFLLCLSALWAINSQHDNNTLPTPK